ncbi:MAG: DegT/DnrJ/EryC1/StrS aminotransferase family protein [Ignavibacteria bacterium]
MKARDNFLSVAIPDITDAEKNEVIDALDSGWISVGPRVKEFERQFAEYHNVKHAVSTSSCTTALLLALKALGITHGDHVIVPTITWQSTANVVEQLDGVPLFCDVEKDTMNIKTEDVERHLQQYSGKVKAIIPVHHSGLPADIDTLEKLSVKYNVPLIYDAAHAVFSSYDNKMIGQFGKMSCFSFYATKNLTTGDGGMITTNDDELAELCRLWSYHGLPKDSWKRYSEENSSPHVQSVVPGFKFNLTDLQAALGLAQLKRKDELLNKRNDLVEYYNEILKDTDWLQTPVFKTEKGKYGNHVYVIKIVDDDVDRDKFMQELRKLNIGTNLHFYPVHKNIYYEKKYPEVSLPNAEWLMNRILTIPLCTKYSKDDIKYVAECLNYVYKEKLAHSNALQKNN